MSSELVPTGDEPQLDSFETSLAAEHAAEHHLMVSIAKAIAIGVPFGIIFFVVLLLLAIGDQTEWYVVVGIGAGLGVLAAVLFGMLAAVTLNSHVLDVVNRDLTGDKTH
jgi:hypothetical protein